MEIARMSDEGQLLKSAAQAVGDNASHLALGAAGVAAAVLRLATYSGPPRPWRTVLADGLAMVLVGYAVASGVLYATGNLMAANAAGILSGLLGWESVKRLAASRVQKENKR